MKARYAVAISLVAGFAVGAIAVHAQSKPPVYYFAEIDITDMDGYMKDFSTKAQALAKGGGARFIVLGGKTKGMIGDPPKSRVVIQQWESMEQLEKWFNSPEQKALRPLQAKYAKVRAFAVEGVAK